MSRFGLGFVGAHRTGKTTLATELAKETNVPFVKSDVSGVYKKHHMDPSLVYSPHETLFIQNKILDFHIELWENQTSYFITDRTPIDMLGYMLCNMPQDVITPSVDVEIQKYKDRCFNSAEKYFYLLLEVLPGIKIVEADLKASTMKSHIEHLSYVMAGSLNHLRDISPATGIHRIPRATLDLQQRVSIALYFFNQYQN